MQACTSMNGSRHAQRLTHTHTQAYAPPSTCSNKPIHSHTIMHSYLHGHSPTHPFTCVVRMSLTNTHNCTYTLVLSHTLTPSHTHMCICFPVVLPHYQVSTLAFLELSALFMYEPAYCRPSATTLLLLQAGTLRILVAQVSSSGCVNHAIKKKKNESR